MKMKWHDILRLAVLNLWRRWARAVLTVTGVVIGTACIVLMVSIGLTNLKQFNAQFLDNASLTTITVNNYNFGDGSANTLKLNDELIEAFKTLPGVKGVTPQLSMQCYMTAGKYENQWMTLYAVDTAVLSDIFQLADGQLIDPQSDTPQILAGRWSLVEFREPNASWDTMEYDEDGNPIPPDIDWFHTPMRLYLGPKGGAGEGVPSSRRYEAYIVGVLKEGNDFSYNSYIDLKVAKRILSENRKLANALGIDSGTYTTAYIFAESVDDVAGILETVKGLGVECSRPPKRIDSVMEEQNRQQGQLSAIGMISLLISAIGIANTMMTSILERRKEIGVLKVVGVSIARIRMLFLTESALIGLAGGIAGVLISYGVGMAIGSGSEGATFLGMYFDAGMKLEIPFWLALSAIGMSVVVGVLSGIYPAWRATKISPLEAMRA